MIAKAKSVSHGINLLNYISGESANKQHPERITHILDQYFQPGLDPLARWNAISMTAPMKNNVIRIELSPSPEYTRNFTEDDWKQLWLDFVLEFDRQVIKDKKGKVISGRTNILGSKATVWLHEESASGTPHLHAAVSRVDEQGRTNNDHDIHLRAQRAAEKVAIKRGWKTATEVREVSKRQVSRDCMDVLRQMGSFSLEAYFQGLTERGYDVRARRDKDDKVVGYTLRKGNCKYNASALGQSRNLMASKLHDTWQKLQREATRDYTIPRNDRQRVVIEHDGQRHERHIPKPVMRTFTRCFYDYSNAAALLNLACYFFAVAKAFNAMAYSGGEYSGGGSTQPGDVAPDGHRSLGYEEEIEQALRCARAAIARIGQVNCVTRTFKR